MSKISRGEQVLGVMRDIYVRTGVPSLLQIKNLMAWADLAWPKSKFRLYLPDARSGEARTDAVLVVRLTGPCQAEEADLAAYWIGAARSMILPPDVKAKVVLSRRGRRRSEFVGG